jgi:arylsulfatase A-like enzyme
LGVAENTMLWFCSDNGPARQGSARHVGTAKNLKGYKLSVNEGGIRVPGLLIWPAKVKSPRTITAPCFTSDYFPTILDALGLEMPSDRTYDGTSLLPFLTGKKTVREKPLGFLNKQGSETVWMEQRFKLINSTKKGKADQLFDIIADPGETKNLAPKKPEITKRLKTALTDWKTAVMNELKQVP